MIWGTRMTRAGSSLKVLCPKPRLLSAQKDCHRELVSQRRVTATSPSSRMCKSCTSCHVTPDAVTPRPNGVYCDVTLTFGRRGHLGVIERGDTVLVVLFLIVFVCACWRKRIGGERMLQRLCQWLMDNVRYFQDDDLMAEQIMQCKEAFSVFDKYGRGAIPIKDLKDVMRYLGLNPTENDIISIMADLDLDSASKIKLNDFIQVVLEQMRQMDTEEEIRKVFKVFDKDNNGLLNAAELKYMMTNMGHKFDDDEVDDLLRQADINGDGHLNYEEFVQMLLS